MKVYNSIREMVGKTPMIRLGNLASLNKVKANLFGKCEFYNPLFSVKDRIGLSMLEALEKEKRIDKDTILVEATSGNTGIALAALCSASGYKLVIIMPENMSEERIKLMRHLGAEVILTPAEEGMQGSIKKAEMLAAKNPKVIILKQFENQANPDAHRFTTSIEIMEDMDREIDAIVMGVATSGTLNGVASTLRTYNPDLYVAVVEPSGSAVLNGKEKGVHKILGIGAGFVPKFYDKSLVNEIFDVSDEQAIEMAKTVARCEGLPIGISAGAAVFVALELAKRADFAGKNIVVILPDSIERALSSIDV